MLLRRKIGYGIGDLGISISYFAVGFFYMYFLTDILGLPPFLAGLAVFIGKLWDGINDPLIGIINDRIRSPLGRKRAFVLFGAVPFGISFVLLWIIPLGAGTSVKFILAILSLLLYATAYSVVVVPYMSLVPIMSLDYDERTQITGIRAMLATVGTIAGGVVALWVNSALDVRLGLYWMSAVFGLITTLCVLVASWNVRHIERGEDHRIQNLSLREYPRLLKEPQLLILLSLKFAGAIATGSLSASIPYFTTHVMNRPGLSSRGLAIYILFSALFIPLWNKLTHRYSKRKLLLVGNILSALVLLAMGLTLDADKVVGFYAGCAVLGMTMSAYLLIPYSLVPDMVEFYMYRHGERHESVFFGLWMAVHQLGLGVSGLVLGTILALFGYTGVMAHQEGTLIGIRIVFGVLPGFFLVVAALVLQAYRVDKTEYRKIREALSEQGGS